MPSQTMNDVLEMSYVMNKQNLCPIVSLRVECIVHIFYDAQLYDDDERLTTETDVKKSKKKKKWR